MFCCLAALPGRFWPGEREHLGLQFIAGRRGGPALASHDVGLAYPGQATLGLTDNMEGLERNVLALKIYWTILYHRGELTKICLKIIHSVDFTLEKTLLALSRNSMALWLAGYVIKNHLASRESKRTNGLIVVVAQPECDPDNSTCITVLPVLSSL